MTEAVVLLINTFLISIFNTYCWYKLPKNKQVETRKLHYIIVTTFSILAMYISNFIFNQPFRMIIVFLLFIALTYFFICKEIKQSIILVVLSQMILAVTETSSVIICSIFFGDRIYDVLVQPIPSILLNIYILTSSILIANRKFMNKLYILFYNNTKDKENILYPIIVIFTLVIATVESHMNLPLPLILITNIIMAIIFISIIISSQNIKSQYRQINSKYETSISSLKEYEVMIDKFRVDTHENKNEILTIRNMIKDNNDKDVIVKYIDKLVDNKIKDNDKIMKQTAKIPAGGLRATIYSKLCLMDKLKIKYRLSISREVKTTDLINLDEELVLKICKILGVFLDNAIDAVAKLKKKEITIEFYNMEGKLCIDITNNFKGNINIDKIGDMKYSTKGKDHGYGLTLVNKLLEEESNRLENEKSINRDTFTQSLKIKM